MNWDGLATYQNGLRKTVSELDKVVDVVQGALLGTQRDARINSPVDTGRMRSSIQAEIATRDNVVSGVTGSDIQLPPYPKFIEHGTRRIRPFRFLGNAFDKWKQIYLNNFKAFIAKALGK